MNKFFRYFLFSSLALSVIFLTSCEEDSETPDGPLSITIDPSDNLIAAPGDTVSVEVNIINGATDTEATVTDDADGGFVSDDNTATSGESIQYIVSESAASGDVITLTFTAANGSDTATEDLEIEVAVGSIIDIATRSDDFETLVLALQEAELVDALGQDGPFTVFAPTDDAFDDIFINSDDDFPTQDSLIEILQYHVIPGVAALSTEVESGYYETLSGDSLYILSENGTVSVNGVEVATADLEADNGVIHAIGEVLLPDLTFYEAFLLAAPDSDLMSETFFSSITGDVFTYNEVAGTDDAISASIDFGYYYGETNLATLASPDAWPTNAALYGGLEEWGTRNNTDFRLTNLTTEGFDIIAASQGERVAAEYEIGTPYTNTGRATALDEGLVVAFQTEGGQFGLIKVVEIIGTDGSDDGIRLEVKVTED
ncbi:fasciclin domain-containing protein [Catalinimonas sp. 4WD22]|uniref:fasciclin domain-containing protein n=1 Tax=Catalinimonas locisalis TaxID=3133978 RepID=UPI003100E5CC